MVQTPLPEVTLETLKQQQQKFKCCYFRGGLAISAGGMSSWLRPLTEKSLSARCCKVPPHLRPRHIRAVFNTSSPTFSRSSAELNSSRSKFSPDIDGYNSNKCDYSIIIYLCIMKIIHQVQNKCNRQKKNVAIKPQKHVNLNCHMLMFLTFSSD